MRSLALVVSLLAVLLSTTANAAPDATKPNVRAITAFVRLDRARYEAQIADTLKMLNAAKAEFAKRGYATQTVRIVTQPFAELVKGLNDKDALAFLRAFDELSEKQGFAPNVGPAMLHDTDDPAAMHLLAQVLSTLPHLNASAIIADDDGIHWKTIRESAKLVRYVTDHSPRSQGNFQFTATAMLEPLGPFYPGAWHNGAGKQFSLGFEGANIVQQVFGATHGDFDASVAELTRQLTIHAKVGEAVGNAIAASSGWTFAGVDPTPAPLGDASIGDAIERFTGGKFGANGTMTAALAITTAVKAVKVKQIGYSGLMLPVMEDKRLAQRWSENLYDIDSVLAYSAVCGTGLDTVPLPGDVSEERLVKIFGDVAALAWKWHKPLSARLQPVSGKKAGDMTEFESQYLFNTTVRADAAATPQMIPATMRAVAIDAPGGPEVLKLRTLPVPAAGENEVLIAVHSAGVAVWDLKIRQSLEYIKSPKFPYVLGSDGSGEVVAVGPGVTRFKLGDAVYGYCWDNPKGGFYAEYVAAPADCFAPLPKGLSLEAAGALGASGLTALSGVDRALNIKAGEKLIIHGASGAVGTLALQLARLRGAQVLATVSGEDGAALVRQLGADAVVDGRSGDVAAATRAFAPNGVDAVLALAGGDALEKCLSALRAGGRVAYPSGVEPVPKAREGITVTSYDALFGDQKVQWAQLNQAVEARKFEVPIAATFSLADAAAAHRRVAAGRVPGKVILKIR